MTLSSTSTQKLAKIPLFQGLAPGQIETLSAIAEETAFARGKQVFVEGQPGDALYAILEGEVDVLKRDSDGNEQVLARITEGGVLGEMSLLNGAGARSATAVAATDVRALKVSSTKFATLIGADDPGAMKVVHNLAKVMAARLHRMNERLLEGPDRPRKKEEFLEFQKLLSNWSF